MLHTFVTVVYPAELDLLKIQARSMAAHCDPALVGQIIVIDNSANGTMRTLESDVLPSYGPLTGLVKIMRRKDVADIPPEGGWHTQQVLKLMIAEHVQTDRYVALDAKSHLVNPLTPSFLVAPDGRATINTYSFANHPLRPDLERTLRYFDQSIPAGDVFSATVPPFTLYTDQVVSMIRHFEATDTALPDAMIENRLLEFFLYGAWLRRQGVFDHLYFDHQRFCPTLWQSKATPEGVAEAAAAIAADRFPFFAVHRTAFARLNAAAARSLSEIWVDAGLLTEAEGLAFIRKRQGRERFDKWSKRLNTAVARSKRFVAGARRAREPGPAYG